MENIESLSALDIVIIAFCMSILLCKGIVFAVKERSKSMKDQYLPGERIITLLPVTVAIFATYMSPVSLMGSPTDIYTYGGMFFINHIGFGVAFLIGSFTVVPLLHPLGITSVFEYMEKRYDSLFVRHFFVAMTMFMTMFFMGVTSLPPTFGLDVISRFNFSNCLVIVGLIAMLYTTIGGLQSFLWTDLYIISLMFISLIIYIVGVCMTLGDGDSSLTFLESGGRIDFTEISLDPRTRHSWWGTIIGGISYWLFTAYSQSTVRKLSQVKSTTSAKMIMLINGLLVIVFGVFILWFGLMIYVFFHYIRCDPILAGLVEKRNHIPPYFVMAAMKDVPGIPGLFFSALFLSSFATLSSGINFMASSTVDDILKKHLSKHSQMFKFIILKLFTVVFSLTTIGLGFVIDKMDGTLVQKLVTVIGAFGSPVTGAFLLGAISHRTNKYGATCCGAVAVAVNVWIIAGANLRGRKARPLPGPPNELCFLNTTHELHSQNTTLKSTYFENMPDSTVDLTADSPTGYDPYSLTFFMFDISYVWYSVIGIFITLTVGTVVSLCTNKYIQIEPSPLLILNIFRKIKSKVPIKDFTKDVIENNGETYVFNMNSTTDNKTMKYYLGGVK